jgi:hypothetical protein
LEGLDTSQFSQIPYLHFSRGITRRRQITILREGKRLNGVTAVTTAVGVFQVGDMLWFSDVPDFHFPGTGADTENQSIGMERTTGITLMMIVSSIVFHGLEKSPLSSIEEVPRPVFGGGDEVMARGVDGESDHCSGVEDRLSLGITAGTIGVPYLKKA